MVSCGFGDGLENLLEKMKKIGGNCFGMGMNVEEDHQRKVREK